MIPVRLSFFDRVKQLHLSMPPEWSGTTKHIVTVLFTFANSEDGRGICASVGRIARHAGEQERTVERILRQLRVDGFLADDGWRVFQRPSGGKVRVRSRRLVLAALTRADRPVDVEPDTYDGLDVVIEPDTYDGLAAIETDIGDGFDQRCEEIEPDICGTAERSNPTSVVIEPVTSDTQTKSKNQEKDIEPRDSIHAPSVRLFDLETSPPPAASSPRSAATRRKPARQRSETPIDPEWQPDAAGHAYASAKGITDIAGEVERFVNYHLSRGKPSANWPASWRTWCMNSEKFRNERANSTHGAPTANTTSRGGLLGAAQRFYQQETEDA